MNTRRRSTLAAILLVSCGPSDDFSPETLSPYPNPFTADNPQWAAQPHRDNPQELLADGHGGLWVTLTGSEDVPGRQLARVDLQTREITRLDLPGASPTGLAMHPDGRFLVAFQRFSNHAAIIDTERRAIVGMAPMDFYAIEGVFAPDGTLWVTNRWRDAVHIFEVQPESDGLELQFTAALPVGSNPRDIEISDDGDIVAVAALTGLELTLIDRAARTVIARVDIGAPVNDVAFHGDRAYVATLQESTHHSPWDGPDTDGDGLPGDGTPNVNFQDVQNELAVVDGRTGELLHRYTSDSICCKDYRDVDPADLARWGDLLPPEDTWIVGGSLPEQIVIAEGTRGPEAWVSYSASNEVQRFDIDPETGALAPGPVFPTAGHNPHGLTLVDGDLFVAHRLSETVGRYQTSDGAMVEAYAVGDLDVGPFPATDAEIGELFNFVTARFTIDGDQSCTHCHREGGNMDKALSMPLTVYAGIGSRMVMSYRGAADSRPWFMESAFDETNFKPVMNEFARIENFCCTDYTLFPDGAPADCETNPPEECASEPNATSLDGFAAATREPDTPFAHPRPTAFPTRDTFYLDRAEEVIDRTESFGDSVYREDPITLERSPVELNFEGITQALGAFLLMEPRLLPNPNSPDSDAATRGREIFERSDVGCVTCHPPPAFGASSDVNPFDVPLRMGPVITPVRADDDTNLDLYAQGFLDTFPLAEQDSCEEVCGAEACEADESVCDDLRMVRMGATTLRGIWDRVGAGMLHDGRARNLREVVCTPGHPALQPGEIGFNERDGVFDTHGGTSHLSAGEVEDLIAYMLTL